MTLLRRRRQVKGIERLAVSSLTENIPTFREFVLQMREKPGLIEESCLTTLWFNTTPDPNLPKFPNPLHLDGELEASESTFPVGWFLSKERVYVRIEDLDKAREKEVELYQTYTDNRRAIVNPLFVSCACGVIRLPYLTDNGLVLLTYLAAIASAAMDVATTRYFVNGVTPGGGQISVMFDGMLVGGLTTNGREGQPPWHIKPMHPIIGRFAWLLEQFKEKYKMYPSELYQEFKTLNYVEDERINSIA